MAGRHGRHCRQAGQETWAGGNQGWGRGAWLGFAWLGTMEGKKGAQGIGLPGGALGHRAEAGRSVCPSEFRNRRPQRREGEGGGKPHRIAGKPIDPGGKNPSDVSWGLFSNCGPLYDSFKYLAPKKWQSVIGRLRGWAVRLLNRRSCRTAVELRGARGNGYTEGRGGARREISWYWDLIRPAPPALSSRGRRFSAAYAAKREQLGDETLTRQSTWAAGDGGDWQARRLAIQGRAHRAAVPPPQKRVR